MSTLRSVTHRRESTSATSVHTLRIMILPWRYTARCTTARRLSSELTIIPGPALSDLPLFLTCRVSSGKTLTRDPDSGTAYLSTILKRDPLSADCKGHH